MVRTKVFVGNLSFKTTEQQLAQEFKAAGTVVSANIITRGPRSLGYGFVELENEEDARNSVKVMNKKEIDGRQINVEVAKPREEEARNPEDRQGSTQNFRGRGRGGFRGGFRGSFRGGRGRGYSYPPKRFRPRNLEEGSAPQNEEQQQQQQQQQQERPRVPRTSNQRGSLNQRGGFRAPRTPIEERANSTPSKTSLFVANLPFALDDEGFGKVFTDAGLKSKSAYVVRKRNGHSKGFGFAEFETEEDQQKALALNGKKVGTPERELIMKIALTEMKEEKNTEVTKKRGEGRKKRGEKRGEERGKEEGRKKNKTSKFQLK